MRTLLAPGVALMNRLRYPQKFAFISLVFAIPLGLMMYLWLAEIGDRLEFARKERVGLEYVVGLRHVLEPLSLGRPNDAPELEHAARGVDTLNTRLGRELQAAEPWRTLRQQLADASVSPAARIQGTVQLIAHVGD